MFSPKLTIELNTFIKWFKDNDFKCIKKNCNDTKDIDILVEGIKDNYVEPGRNKLDKILKMIIENEYYFLLYDNEIYETEKETKSILKYFKRDDPPPVKTGKKSKTPSLNNNATDNTDLIEITEINAYNNASNQTINFILDNTLNTDECDYVDTLDMITDDLIEIFGTPVNSNIPDERHRYEWKFKSSDGYTYHLYDWKFENEDFPKLMDAEWYIGTDNPSGNVSYFWAFMNTKFNELQVYYDNLEDIQEDTSEIHTENSTETLVENNVSLNKTQDNFDELFDDISAML